MRRKRTDSKLCYDARIVTSCPLNSSLPFSTSMKLIGFMFHSGMLSQSLYNLSWTRILSNDIVAGSCCLAEERVQSRRRTRLLQVVLLEVLCDDLGKVCKTG